jgi:hypothetical protein
MATIVPSVAVPATIKAHPVIMVLHKKTTKLRMKIRDGVSVRMDKCPAPSLLALYDDSVNQ